MLKAVIANEKKKSNLMLRELINWNTLGIEVVAMAESGEEALHAVISTVPDIVVISARIKGMYGPDLVQEARQHGVNASFIVVQGTRSFDSCYAALKSGVEDYLVGQVNTAELTAALKKVCDRRLQEELREENERKERRLFENNRDMIRRHFVSSFLSGTTAADNPEPAGNITRINGEAMFNFRPGIFEVIRIRPDFKPGSDINRGELQRVIDEMGAVAEEQLAKRCYDMAWFAHHGELICVLNYNGNVDKEIRILLERVKRRVRDRFEGSCTLGRGIRAREITGLVDSAVSARHALESRLVLGVDQVLDAEQMSDLNADTSEVLNPERESHLRSCVEALNSKGFGTEVEALFLDIGSRVDIAPTVYYAAARQLGTMVLEQLRESGVQPGNPNAVMDEFMRSVHNCYTPAMLRTAVVRWGVGLLERMLYEKDGQESRTMRLAKAYIREHYRESIRLADVAGEVHLNPSYFSTLFKKELGMNFNDFLIDCRLAAARDLLRTTTLSIGKIAENVGYGDSKYFSKLFVKVVGMKPSEYRRLYS